MSSLLRRTIPALGRHWRRWLAMLLVMALTVGVGVEMLIRRAPLPDALKTEPVGTTTLLDRHGQPLARLSNSQARLHLPVPLKRISPEVARATIGLEDHRFHQHPGVDFHAMAAASFRNLLHFRVVSGASTITQQLIKISSPAAPRTWRVKLRESLAALRLERLWSKDRILESYLNRVDYGNRLIGIEAAANQYFGKSAAALTAPEAVFLAALPQAPSRHNPWKHSAAAASRYQRAVKRLAGLHLIPDQDNIWQTAPGVRPRQPELWAAPHFVQTLIPLVQKRGGSVRSTLDPDLQRRLQGIVDRHLERLAIHSAHHAAVVVLDHQDGAVRAWVGSGGWHLPEGRIDGVTLPRSCGSTLKPLLYLQALDEKRLTAASLLPDTPDAIRAEYLDYDPRNYDQRFWGPVRLREALGNSLNVPAVYTLSKVGARSFLHFLGRAGIHPPRRLEDYGAGLILGNAEVRLLDLTAAFGAFANSGIMATPRLLEELPPRHRAIASPEAAEILADMLSDDQARRKTFGPFSPLAFENARVPCKTGTSSAFRDAWTVGVTGRHAIGVWIGNFSGAPMRELASVTGPAPLWRDIVSCLLPEDGDVPAPTQSKKLTCIPVCSLTGLLPASASPAQVSEWFLHGTPPITFAQTLLRPDESGTVRVTLPPEYAVWCASSHNYLDAIVRQDTALRIVKPRPGSTFLIDPFLPSERQHLEFKAVGTQGRPLEWRLNGLKLAMTTADTPVSWLLAPGSHRVEVSDGTSVTAATFTVEP